MIDEDRTAWTLGQLADEVIEACELPMGCRATIIAALGDAKGQGKAEGERENAALREAALKAVHTIGKALHGEGKDFRDLDHTYKLLIDLLPAEALSQGGVYTQAELDAADKRANERHDKLNIDPPHMEGNGQP